MKQEDKIAKKIASIENQAKLVKEREGLMAQLVAIEKLQGKSIKNVGFSFEQKYNSYFERTETTYDFLMHNSEICKQLAWEVLPRLITERIALIEKLLLCQE